MNIIEAIHSLNLELLPDGWVEEIWRSDFSEDTDAPLEFQNEEEEDYYYNKMIFIVNAIKVWLNADSPSGQSRKSWTTLSDLGFDHRPVICFLSIFIKSNYSDYYRIRLGLTACTLYINLISIPGSIVLNIFNPNLFQKSVNSLSVVKLCSTKKFNQKPSKKKNVNNITDCDSKNLELSDFEKSKVLFKAGYLLSDLYTCLSELHLKDEYSSLMDVIRILVELTRTEKLVNVISATQFQKNSTAYIARRAYDILQKLTNEEHGEPSKTVSLMLKYFVPSLTINEEDFRMSLVEKNEVRKHTWAFVHKLLSIGDDNILNTITGLFQLICLKIPEKEDMKSKIIPDLVANLKLLTEEMFHGIVIWVISLMFNNTTKNRIVAADVIAALLNVSHKFSEDDDFCPSRLRSPVHGESDSVPATNNFFSTLFAAILAGTCDVSSMMRTKCLAVLAKLISSNQLEIQNIVNKIFDNFSEESSKVDYNSNNLTFDFISYLNLKPTSYPEDPLPTGNQLLKIMEHLTCDDKVLVRKNACHVISNIFLIKERAISRKLLKILVLRAKDFYVSVRKIVSKCLTDLILRYPSKEEIINAWVDGVLMLLVDDETKSAEKAVEYTRVVIIDNINHYERSTLPKHHLPWKVLDIIFSKEKRYLFTFACSAWENQGLFKPDLLRKLQSHIGSENNLSVWFLLLCISEFTTLQNADFIYTYFLENVFSVRTVSETLAHLVTESLYLNWASLSRENQLSMHSKIKSGVEEYKVSFQLIARYMDYCFKFRQEETREWCGHLLKKCEHYLRETITRGAPARYKEELLIRYIVTLGEAALFHPGVSAETLVSLASLIDPGFSKAGAWEGLPSPRVKAAAIITIGKVCLQDHLLAKAYAPFLAAILTSSSTVPMKNNALMALSDLCRRYTSVVEDYLGDMCLLLRDRNVTLRKESLTLLTALIQEDFLKVKNHLLYYLLMMLLDSSPQIRERINVFLVQNVLKKYPKIFSSHFIDVILFFNDHKIPGRNTEEEVSDKEKVTFSLAGVHNFKERRKIYQFMLRHLIDLERFCVLNRLSTDILDAACKGVIPLEGSGNAVVKDALFCMACKQMRLEALQQNTDNVEFPARLLQKTIVGSIMKKNYVEHVIPTIAELKRQLMDRKSPLTKDLMICLRELMKDYKHEIDDMLQDQLLANEVALDLRNYIEEDIADDNVINGEVYKDLRVTCMKMSDEFLNQYIQTSSGIEVNGQRDGECGSPLEAQTRVQSAVLEPIAGPSSRPDPPLRRLSDSEITTPRKKGSKASQLQGVPSSEMVSPQITGTQPSPTSTPTMRPRRKGSRVPQLPSVAENQSSCSLSSPTSTRHRRNASESCPESQSSSSSPTQVVRHRKKGSRASRLPIVLENQPCYSPSSSSSSSLTDVLRHGNIGSNASETRHSPSSSPSTLTSSSEVSSVRPPRRRGRRKKRGSDSTDDYHPPEELYTFPDSPQPSTSKGFF